MKYLTFGKAKTHLQIFALRKTLFQTATCLMVYTMNYDNPSIFLTIQCNYLVQVRQLLVTNQSIFVWELPSTQQTSHLLPVSQLLLLILHSFQQVLIIIAVTTVGSHKATLKSKDSIRGVQQCHSSESTKREQRLQMCITGGTACSHY